MSEPQERERGRGDAGEVLSAHHALHVDLAAVEVRDRAGETVRLREGADDLRRGRYRAGRRSCTAFSAFRRRGARQEK